MKKNRLLLTASLALGMLVLLLLAGCSGYDYSEIAGDYQDRVSQRATLTINGNDAGDAAAVTVYWSSSNEMTTRWDMTVTMEDNTLSYSDCKCTETLYDEEGNITKEKTVYTDGEGYLELTEDGVLKWTGASDEDCRSAEFVMLSD
ncbi:MAG: hypothetical protein ACI4KL_05080 [Lentihominibacter sp.]